MENSDWTIPGLLELSGGYWATCALHAGVRLDVFTPLNGVTLSAEEVASVCHCDPRAMEMLLNALVSIGLIDKNATGYSATGFSAQYLVRTSPGYMGHIIRHSSFDGGGQFYTNPSEAASRYAKEFPW
jgi:hypothetical protein